MNTESHPLMDSAASSPSVLNPESRPIRPTRGLSRLAGFSERQLEHINSWLDEAVPYRKIIELCHTEFEREVPLSTIQRYARRCFERNLIEDLSDSKEAAAEISKYAATGDPSFSTNTLELLEQQAFDLALAHHRDGDAKDLHTLQQLWNLIHKAKSASVRQRHTAVQEAKRDLHRDEFALKTKLANHRITLDFLKLNLPPGEASPAQIDDFHDSVCQGLTATPYPDA